MLIVQDEKELRDAIESHLNDYHNTIKNKIISNTDGKSIFEIIQQETSQIKSKEDFLSILTHIKPILRSDQKIQLAKDLMRNSNMLKTERHFFRSDKESIETRSMHKAMQILVPDKISYDVKKKLASIKLAEEEVYTLSRRAKKHFKNSQP